MPPKNRKRNPSRRASGGVVPDMIVTSPKSPAAPIVCEGPTRSETVIRLIEDKSQSLLESVAQESMAFAANAPSRVQTKLSKILTIIQKPVVDILQLRALVLSQGLPEARYCAPSLRSLVWKLLLGVIPAVRSDWVSHLDEKRKLYDEYVYGLIQEPEQVSYLRFGAVSPSNTSSVSEGGPVSRRPADDHPLALVDSPSRWRRYWSDQDIFDQVNKDVYRTRPLMEFFSENGDSRMVTPRGNAATLSMLATEGHVSPKKLAQKSANIVSPKSHYDRLARILFLFSKLNYGYIQGMNEILAPIYYTFYHDMVQGPFVEADSFWALAAVMTEQRDIFCKNMDESSSGMYGRLAIVESLLAKVDPEVANHLSKIGIRMDFFALRWIMLWFAQEFDMPSVQVLWDALFSDQNPASRFGSSESLLVHYVAVAMIRKVRNALLDGDFADAMRTLKRYPPFDPKEIVGEALRMRKSTYSQRLNAGPSGSSVDLSMVISHDLHDSPVHQRSDTVDSSPSQKKKANKKPSLSTRFMNFVKRKPKTKDVAPIN